ncbi:hypothetical protein D910_03998 [Dendroctonus ponderosae]
MRVQMQHDASAERFAKQLLDIENEKMTIDRSTNCITLPTDFCEITATKARLMSEVFPNMTRNYKNHDWLSARAILAARNNDVDAINFHIQNEIPGEAITSKSIDTMMIYQNEAVNYPTEFLNSLNLPSLPPHVLELKIGVLIILLRNINPPQLCNGTRLSLKTLPQCIQYNISLVLCTIISGKFKGEYVLLPRIPMIPTDVPFEFKRLQFQVPLAFGMTISKAQGQSLQVYGLYLANPCCTHGQLYIACLPVGKHSDLFVYAPQRKTKNMVYPGALQ